MNIIKALLIATLLIGAMIIGPVVAFMVGCVIMFMFILACLEDLEAEDEDNGKY